MSKIDDNSKYNVICWFKLKRTDLEKPYNVYVGKYTLEPLGSLKMYKQFINHAMELLVPYLYSYKQYVDMTAEFLFAKNSYRCRK